MVQGDASVLRILVYFILEIKIWVFF